MQDHGGEVCRYTVAGAMSLPFKEGFDVSM